MYFDGGIERNFSTDEIICTLRDSQGKILQNSSISGFHLFNDGYKIFRFNKTLSKGPYFITCCLNSPDPDENHEYPIKFYYANRSYEKGSRYISAGNDFDNWNARKIAQGDALFKVTINVEETIKTSDRSYAYPPNVPKKPSGPSLGLVGTEYSFSTSAIDLNNDNIMYIFDWGDGTSSPSKYYNSSFSASETHSWNFLGNYSIKVRATDSHGFVSHWSEQSRIVIESPDKEGILVLGQQAILYFLAIFGLYSLLNKFELSSLFKKYLRGKYSNIDTNNLLDSTITRGSFTGLILSGVFSTYLEYDINITNVVFVTVSCIFIFIVKLRNYKKSNL